MLKRKLKIIFFKNLKCLAGFFLIFLFSVIFYGCGDFHIKDRAISTISKKYVIENYYVDPDLMEGEIRRVLLVPPKNLTNYEESRDLLEESRMILEGELRLAKKFDIVRYQDVLTKEQMQIVDNLNIDKQGSYDADAMFDIGRAANVQGILFTSITQYKPVKPMATDKPFDYHYQREPFTVLGKIIRFDENVEKHLYVGINFIGVDEGQRESVFRYIRKMMYNGVEGER